MALFGGFGTRTAVIPFVVLMLGVASAVGAQPPSKGAVPLCDNFQMINAELPDLIAVLGINSSDFDGDDVPENATLALIRGVACFHQENAQTDTLLETLAAFDALSEAAQAAYDLNLAALDAEPNAAELAAFREVIAVLMFVSVATQDALEAALADSGMPLSGFYEVVTCDATDSCLPAALPGKEGYEVLGGVAKAPNEPYSGSGDPDADTFTNADEFTNTGFNLRAFAAAAMDPEVGGPIASIADVGGGGCFIATAAYGTPMADEIESLRAVRDRFLLRTPAGVAFVDSYYRLSPAVAEGVAKSAVLRAVVRIALAPVVLASRAALWSPYSTAFAALALCGMAGMASGRLRRKV